MGARVISSFCEESDGFGLFATKEVEVSWELSGKWDWVFEIGEVERECKGNISSKNLTSLAMCTFLVTKLRTVYAFWCKGYPRRMQGWARGINLSLWTIEVVTKHKQPKALRLDKSATLLFNSSKGVLLCRFCEGILLIR